MTFTLLDVDKSTELATLEGHLATESLQAAALLSDGSSYPVTHVVRLEVNGYVQAQRWLKDGNDRMYLLKSERLNGGLSGQSNNQLWELSLERSS